MCALRMCLAILNLAGEDFDKVITQTSVESGSTGYSYLARYGWPKACFDEAIAHAC